jgi:hypothetical protein
MFVLEFHWCSLAEPGNVRWHGPSEHRQGSHRSRARPGRLVPQPEPTTNVPAQSEFQTLEASMCWHKSADTDQLEHKGSAEYQLAKLIVAWIAQWSEAHPIPPMSNSLHQRRAEKVGDVLPRLVKTAVRVGMSLLGPILVIHVGSICCGSSCPRRTCHTGCWCPRPPTQKVPKSRDNNGKSNDDP